MKNLTFNKAKSILHKNSKTVICFTVAGLTAGLLYSGLAFKPMYTSKSKLLIKNMAEPVFVSELAAGRTLPSATRVSNPLLNEMEILKSQKLAQRVWQDIKSQYNLDLPDEVGSQKMAGAISVENPLGTDILEVTAKWESAKISNSIAQAYKNEYIRESMATDKINIMKTKDSIDRQLQSANENLMMARLALKDFRQANNTVDIDTEAGSAVAQRTDLENRYNEILSNAALAKKQSSAIASKLGLDWKKAIDSAAIGNNPTFNELQSHLGTAKEDYAGLSAKYTPEHPAMKALQSKIDGINSELRNQIKMTVGNEVGTKQVSINNAPQNTYSQPIIGDPVRTGMIESLATNEALYRGLLAQASVIRSSIGGLNSRIESIPNKQARLAELTQNEANWVAMVNTLKTKAVEANIRESEIVSNIQIVEEPPLPLAPTFPTRAEMTLLFALLGLISGCASIITSYIWSEKTESADELEEIFAAPTLGSIPWLSKEVFAHVDLANIMQTGSNFYSFAYENIISNLNIKGHKNNKKALVFTSSEYSKTNSSMLVNIADGLSKTGNSVVILDADFRTPTVHESLGMENQEVKCLPQLLTAMTYEKTTKGEFNWHQLGNFLQKVPGYENVYAITNTENVSEPYEFLHSIEMNELISKLKANFDWVLIDTPPVVAVPDAVATAVKADGVIISTGLDAAKPKLQQIKKMFANNNIEVFGVIARNQQSQEAASDNRYIKQIISRIIPSEEDIYVETKKD